ncbi:MAG: Ig domain-containing protein [Bacteroidaceae bacterium]|nr:Ig domain-containing protein [Bacteroidaceae bacterium]
MKTRNFLAALLLMVAGLQTAWAQGFRVYQSDGTQFNFSLKTDSIVFDNGLSGDEVFGPFTPVNQCIVGTWQWGGSTVTFNADGTTDFNEGSTYEFMPYQGIIIIYNASGKPSTALFVYKLTSEEMYTNATNMSRVNVWTRVHQEGQPVTGITLSATTLSLQPGATKQLTATVSPADAANTSVTWQSLDELVATVSSSGLVTAVGNGSTKILCRANDGSGVVAECQVTVGSSSGTPVTSITLSQTTLSLAVGSTQTLTATVLPTNATNKSVAWTSSNTSVATVSQAGTVSALASGSCTIVCSATDGSGVYAECQVTVTAGTPVTSITLNETAINLNVGGSQTLTATVLPENASNKTVAWSSNDTSVASVNDSGKVTAHTRGSCTITCRATDGSGVKATCAVTVSGVTSGTTDGHGWVDLGLPDGTRWATCNIGADTPEETGNYYAFGETEPKSDYSWTTYIYCNGTYNTMTKYCIHAGYGYNGFTDGLTELLPEDDAATANWSENWQMPSQEQIENLINSTYTTTEITTQNGVEGAKITSRSNGESIFLPCSGYREGTELKYLGRIEYRSRCLDTDQSNGSIITSKFNNQELRIGYGSRMRGCPVRPVLK